MNRIITTAILLGLALGIAQAQTASEFYFEPDTSWVYPPASDPDSAAHTEIHSAVNTDITVKWQRQVVSMTGGCLTQVCDLNVCYGVNKSSEDFVLAAGSTGPISVHLINNAGTPCKGIIRLDMWNADAPATIIPAFFMFNETPITSVSDVYRVDEIKVYPNPATEYFVVEDERVALIRMMTLDGREVVRFNTTTSRQCQLRGIEKGMYTLVMEDKDGKPTGVAQLDVF